MVSMSYGFYNESVDTVSNQSISNFNRLPIALKTDPRVALHYPRVYCLCISLIPQKSKNKPFRMCQIPAQHKKGNTNLLELLFLNFWHSYNHSWFFWLFRFHTIIMASWGCILLQLRCFGLDKVLLYLKLMLK